MVIAVHPESGEVAYLTDDGQWKPAQTAVHPQTRKMMAFDGKTWADVPVKSKGLLNYVDDAVRSLASGVTLGWSDELAAKGNELLGRGTYDENVKAERAKNDQISPYIKIPGEIAGAMMLPVGAALSGATLPARMGRGAAVGGAMGAVHGAGEGTDVPSRAAGAAVGLGLGAGIGAVAPPLVEGAIQGGRALVGPIANAVRGAVNPADEAGRRVVTALQRDVQNDPGAVGRLTPQEFAANAQGGGPATIMDIGGETPRGLARSAANTSPEGRQVLNTAINDRFEGQTTRVSDYLRGAFHYPNATAQRDAIEQTARRVNDPAYARAMHDGSGGVWDAELQRLAGAPAIQAAARDAIPSLSNRSITEGFRAPRQNPLTVAEDGRATLTTTPNGNQIVPDLRFWDQVKRGIDAQIGKAERNADSSKVQELTGLKNSLVESLDRLVPTYQQARAGAAHFFGAENALEAGQNYVTQNFANTETRRALSQMSQSERQLFQDGFVSRLTETIERTGDRRTVVNKIAESPQAREKLEIALGPQRAQELEARLRVEGIMDLARGAVQGNSTTARQLAEIGFAGGAGGIGGYGVIHQDPQTMTIGAVMGALAAGRRGIDHRVARQVATMLASNDPVAINRGIQVIARNRGFMDSLRVADGRLAAAGSEQAPTGFLSAAQPGARADDQPEIPRPPGQ
jgi:hypothetical protein